jgi:hypothetical protein
LEGTGSVADIQESILEGTGYVLKAPGYILDVINFAAEAHGLRRKVQRFKDFALVCRLKVLVWAGLRSGASTQHGKASPAVPSPCESQRVS